MTVVQASGADSIGLLDKISTGNSSSSPLTSGAVFVGEWDEIASFAMFTLSVFADQASAANGLEFQWSSDAINVDVSETTTVSASVGRAFALTPRARYFRTKYTNGGTNQGAFRLQVVCHVAGTGVITRPLDKNLSDQNFAQTVRAVIALGSASSRTNLDSGQATMAGSLPVTIASNQSAIPASQSGTWNVGHGKTLNFFCLDQPGAGTTVIAVASASNRHKVVGLFATVGAAGTLKFIDGTGDLSGAMNLAAAGGLVLPTNPLAPYIQTAVNSALSVVTTISAAKGAIVYITEP